jgi:hypothetical protein
VMRDQLQQSADQQLVQQYVQIARDSHVLEHAFGRADSDSSSATTSGHSGTAGSEPGRHEIAGASADKRVRTIAQTGRTYFLRDVTINKHHFRGRRSAAAAFWLRMIVRSLTDVDHGSIALTHPSYSSLWAGLAWLRSRRTRGPCDARSGSAPHGCSRAHRGDRRPERACAGDGGGELARLGTAFNTMLGRSVDRDAAPVRRGRVARAPHAAHEPPDEHQGLKQRDGSTPASATSSLPIWARAHECDLITGLSARPRRRMKAQYGAARRARRELGRART